LDVFFDDFEAGRKTFNDHDERRTMRLTGR
jgi:hypothetical protein